MYREKLIPIRFSLEERHCKSSLFQSPCHLHNKDNDEFFSLRHILFYLSFIIIMLIKGSPVRGCDIGIGVPLTRGMTKITSKSMLVLLVPLNRYVCFPASGGTVSVQSPGFRLATSNIVTNLYTVVFSTEFPMGISECYFWRAVGTRDRYNYFVHCVIYHQFVFLGSNTPFLLNRSRSSFTTKYCPFKERF